MEMIDTGSAGGFLGSVWYLITGVLRLDPAAYVAAREADGGLLVALAVLAIGGVSYLVGQSVVLFLNRVSRRQFVTSLAAGVALLMAGVLFWSLAAALTADLLLGASAQYRTALIVVSASHAPLVFGFLLLLPYLGTPIASLLRIWVALCLVVGINAVGPADFWSALLCLALGWLVLQAATWVAVRLVPGLNGLMWWTVARRPRWTPPALRRPLPRRA
jgi:hypothetical protein